MTWLAVYFVGLAFALLWGELQLGGNRAQRGEQLVFSLAWPIMVAGSLSIIAFGVMCDAAEAFDRMFGR